MDLAPGRRARLLVALALVVLAVLAARSGAEVITLTEETFSDKITEVGRARRVQIKEKDTVWFVKFCVPWCKHCKNLGTLWEDLGKVMEGADEIEIGQVDCGVSKPVCSKVDIHSYPTFKVFYEGEEVAKYKGPRNVESLKNFVLDEAEKVGEAKLQDS
uniref:Thioredoxin domain-containing protein n=1 Tax=Oryza punctata TaxID=4537 RepID=A0A0E0KCB2_ORYPU